MDEKLTYNDWPPGEALALRRFAHDLMTPITVLIGNMQLFQMRKDLPAPVAAKIDDLYKQTHNLMKLIQDTQVHAYDAVWTGDSGSLWARGAEGVEAASSVLARAGVTIVFDDQQDVTDWAGEPEAWREWFASLFAMIANKIERGGSIRLSVIDNGWRLFAAKVTDKDPNFSEWLGALTGEYDAQYLTGCRRYRELLFLNNCAPIVNLTDVELTIDFIK